MIDENYEDWRELLENFPCETLREINRLWLENSNNKFGISIQAEIYQSLGSPSYGDSNWDVFGERVGWKQDHWLSYDELMEKFEKKNVQERSPSRTSSSPLAIPTLPVSIYTKFISNSGSLRFQGWAEWVEIGWERFCDVGRGGKRVFFSRIATCKL